MEPDSPLVSRVVLARHWHPAPPGRRLTQGFVHVTCNRPSTPAVQVATMFATSDREASAHVVVGADYALQCVPESGVAYAAPGANAVGYHAEVVEMPDATLGEWVTAPQFQLAAQVMADCFARNLIPAVLGDGAWGLLRGEPGLYCHWDATQAVHLAHRAGGAELGAHSVDPLTDAFRGYLAVDVSHATHTCPYRTEGPRAGVDQFDLEAFYAVFLNALPSDYDDRLRDAP